MNWLTLIPTLVTCAIGVAYFFDKYFGSRRGGQQDSDIERLTERSWSMEDRITLERRLVKIEGDIAMFHELIELRERIAANILRKNE
jgi:hypothetical protein